MPQAAEHYIHKGLSLSMWDGPRVYTLYHTSRPIVTWTSAQDFVLGAEEWPLLWEGFYKGKKTSLAGKFFFHV